MTGAAVSFSPRPALTAVSRAALVALGASIPISIATDNILLAVALLAWLATWRYREWVDDAKSRPVVLFAWIWIAVHFVGASWSIGNEHDIWRNVGKATIFVAIPIAVPMLHRDRDRELALHALMAALGLTVALSCLRWLGVIPHDAPLLKYTEFSPGIVFKYHLTQNLLLAFGAFLFAVQATRVNTRKLRVLFAALASLTCVNVLVMGDGRSGQVVLIALIVYFGAWRGGFKGACIAAVGAACLVGAAYVTPHSALQRRADVAVTEARDFEQKGEAQSGNSVGLRLQMYTNTLHILTQHPLIGVGTGGFAAAYEREVRGTDRPVARHPHNEYLLKAAEFGVAGPLLLLAFVVLLWRGARDLPDPAYRALSRGLAVTLAIASLAVSSLGDHTEALFFVWLTGVLFASGARRAVREPAGAVGLGQAR